VVVVSRTYALDAPRNNWLDRALCVDYPDMWSSAKPDDIAMAMHVCVRHCPVRAECAALGESTPRDLRRGVIYGGRRYLDKNGELDVEERVLHRSCARCRDGR